MAAATRIGDNSTAHDCFPSTNAISGGASTVYVNGLPAGITGLQFAPHSCNDTTHELNVRVVVSGSSSVFIEGKAMIRAGDQIICGDNVGQGSENVFCA